MAQLKFGSAGVSATEIDLSQPLAAQPVGVPAGIIGTAAKGPAFLPVTVGLVDDFYRKFGLTDGVKFGPLAVSEWLRNAGSVTYLRVLGAGDGTKRLTNGDVNQAGFTVGEQEPQSSAQGSLGNNPYSNFGGALGRTYFLGCFMSESAGSTRFSSAGIQQAGSQAAAPIVRGVLMAASGVILTLSASAPGITNSKPSATSVASNTNGSALGDVTLLAGAVAKQDFVLLLNGLQGTNPLYPNVITASFDMTSPNYIANVLNTNPANLQQAGHYLYSHWDISAATAAVTGSGLITASLGAGPRNGVETAAFLLTSSLTRDVGSSTVPDYEDFRDRFSHAVSPWVVSQPFGGKPVNLFRVHALDDGTGVSTLYKLSIENIAASSDPTNQHGTFDLVVRKWNDNDLAPVYLEQWRGLSLDPSDDRYIARVIGDAHAYFDFDRTSAAQKVAIDGNYRNASNYIRIEVDANLDAGGVDPTALPVGSRGTHHLVTAGTGTLAAPVTPNGAWANSNSFTGSLFTSTSGQVFASTVVPPVPFRVNITQGSGTKQQVNPLLYWGVQFEHVTSVTTPNLSTQPNLSLNAFAAFYPEHRTDVQNFSVGDNNGAAAVNGAIIDADLFNNNFFSLMNVQVVTNSVGIADSTQWVNATYVRNGVITASDANKTRGLLPADFVQANRRFLKWSFFLRGGFDGTNVFDVDESALNSNAVEADMNATNRNTNNGATVSAYNTALNVMADTSNVDIQLLAVPGVRHPVVTDAGVAACQNRGDAMFLMDIEQIDTAGFTVSSSVQQPSVTLTAQNFANRAENSSYAAAYFPDVVMTDPNTLTNVVVPPSVAVLGAFALNDAVGHPWFAPAGFTRGALQTTQEAVVKLTKGNMDVLYDVNINPLVAFPGNASGGTNPKGGVLVWGQKTLYQQASALDRVNVRRLLLTIRRSVRDIANRIIFEPNRDATLAAFSAAVTPVLQKIQAQAGLDRFRVVIDSSTTSQQDIENNTIRGKIFVQPTRSIEYVSLDFVVTNNLAQQ
jgi:phage tail sheath protein FI